MKMYSNYTNLLGLRNEGIKRLFIIFHFMFFVFLIYWFFDSYKPSDFWLLQNERSGYPRFSVDDDIWNTYDGLGDYFAWLWMLFKLFWVFLFILLFTFGIPILFHKLYLFSKKLRLKYISAKSYLIFNFLIFGLFFWLLWFQLDIKPFEKIEFDTKIRIQETYIYYGSTILNSTPKFKNYKLVHKFLHNITEGGREVSHSYFFYRNNYNSKFFYDFLLILIPFLISFIFCSAIANITLWVREGYEEV